MSDSLEVEKISLVYIQEKRRNRAIKWMKIFYIACGLLLSIDVITLAYLFITKNQSIDDLLSYPIFSVYILLSFIFYVVVLIIGGVFFLQWNYGAYKNLQLAGIKQQHSPLMAIWGFIIPVINIIYSGKILKELAEKLSKFLDVEKQVSLDKTIHYWWILFVSGMLLNRQSYKTPDDTYNNLLIGWSIDLGARIVWLCCTFMVIRMLVQMGNLENKFLEKINMTVDVTKFSKLNIKSFSISGYAGMFAFALFLVNLSAIFIWAAYIGIETELPDSDYLMLVTVMGAFVIPVITGILTFIDLLRFLYNWTFKKYINQNLLNSIILNIILLLLIFLIVAFFLNF